MSAPGSRISEHTLRRRIYFYECDGAGIVHFSNYFRFMEEAEHGLWRATGLGIARADLGVGFPRVAASFEYHRPLRFEDEVGRSASSTAATPATYAAGVPKLVASTFAGQRLGGGVRPS